MRFDVITIFPELINDYKKIGIIARAQSRKLVDIHAYDLRKYTADAHKTVDGRPYGGGAGMVLKADIMLKAIKGVAGKAGKRTKIILLTPAGKVFSQAHAKQLAKNERLVFVSGRYEGFDERISQFVDEQFSIGDYVLMGGELAALVMIETIARFIPGVVGKEESVHADESFSKAGSNTNLLEYPQYTRPEVLKFGKKTLRVPKILLAGDHKKIEMWRADQALKKTKKIRPDLLSKEL